MSDIFTLPFTFNNTYAEKLAEMSAFQQPQAYAKAKWLIQSPEVANLLDLSDQAMDSSSLLDWFAGNAQHSDAAPLAQKYTGHQFGHYNPELGDGRGILLGEVESTSGRWDIHIKGAGTTPFSRFGDGRAVLRSCIREFLGSEALYHLGIPTSRALGVYTTGEQVQRETFEQGAALIRVAPSHIRFGHFEYAYYQQDTNLLVKLVDYTFKDVLALPYDADAPFDDKQKAFQVLQFAVTSTAQMVAKWQALGFCHGVMNTDNMSILGITFDYGPFGFLDDYNPKHICNHSDHSGRYAFDEQPGVAMWNLNVLAHALSPLLSRAELETALKQYEPCLLAEYSELMRGKLGLVKPHENDRLLLGELLALMQQDKSDYTNTWRLLSDIEFGANEQAFIDNFITREKAQAWLEKYKTRVFSDPQSDAARRMKMKQNNPKYILRNYLAQQAIEAAEQGDTQELKTLFEVLKSPYAEQTKHQRFAKLPPDWSRDLSISCSS